MKRLRSQADPSSESSQLNSSNNRSDRKDKPRPPKKSKRELKIEAERKRLEDFYNERSNFFAQFDDFQLKVQTPGRKGPKKGVMDPLDASLGDIEPDDADLDFLLDPDNSNKAPHRKRRSSRLKEKENPIQQKHTPRRSGDTLPEAKKFFETNLDALASSNIDGDFLSESSPKSTQRRTSTRMDSSSERDVVEELENEQPDFEFDETPPVYNSASAIPSISRSHTTSIRNSSKSSPPVSSSTKAPVPVVKRRSSRKLLTEKSKPDQAPKEQPVGRVTRQSSRAKVRKEGLENPELLEEYHDYLEEEKAEGNLQPWTLEEYYEKVWKAAGFK